MSQATSIEWTDATWNPVRGCTRISPGCGGPNKQGGCYAEKIAARFSGPGLPYEGLARYVNGEARWTGKMMAIDAELDWPLRWRGSKRARVEGRASRIFVNSMSDLFHENLSDAAIDRVFALMALCPQHVFQVLTKRADRLQAYFANPQRLNQIIGAIWWFLGTPRGSKIVHNGNWRCALPLPNVWLGVSVEDQHFAEQRIPLLLSTPAAKRFISAEPLIGPVDLAAAEDGDSCLVRECWGSCACKGAPARGCRRHDEDKWVTGLDWVIVGGESGEASREFDLEWARQIVAECRSAEVPVFVKQIGRHPVDSALCDEGDAPAYGAKHPKGGDLAEWPAELRVQEFPR